MVYSITTYHVPLSKSASLIQNLRPGGLLYELTHQLPGHISTSVLVDAADPNAQLVIQFWRTLDAALAARTSPAGVFLADVMNRIAISSASLGLFCFPSIPEELLPSASEESVGEPHWILTSRRDA
jgi:hypothetical protein